MKVPTMLALLLCLGSCKNLNEEAGLTGNNAVTSIRYEKAGTFPFFQMTVVIDHYGKIGFSAESEFGSHSKQSRKLDERAFRRLATELSAWRVPAGDSNFPARCDGPDYKDMPAEGIIWAYSDGREGRRVLYGCGDAPSNRFRLAMRNFKERLSIKQWEKDFFHQP